MGLRDLFKRRKEKKIIDNMSFEEKFDVYLDGLSRKEAEQKAEELKRKFGEEELVSNIKIFGVDISKSIDDAYKKDLYQKIDDAVIVKYGTNEEIIKLNKRKEEERIKREEQKRLDELEKQKFLEEEKVFDKIVDNNLKGDELEQQGKIDDAQKLYEENVELNANTPFTYSRLASIYHYKKQFEDEGIL